MALNDNGQVERAKRAAIEVLLSNLHGPYRGLPRTAGWGYPEPYTRDLLISGLGFLVSGEQRLIASLRRVLETLAANQTPRGHIPSLVHDPEDRGASDTTPLFLLILAIYRRAAGEGDFLADAAARALTWMEYASPADRALVAQLPTTDWRDEQAVTGFGLYVNALTYAFLRLHGRRERADQLAEMMCRFTITAEDEASRRVHEGLTLKRKPYYAMCSFKIFSSERFDLLGNSLAILTGIAPLSRAKAILAWIERECQVMRARGDLAVDLSPNFFPFVRPGDPEWSRRYELHNRPGIYHNGGVWPFVSGFHIAAMVAAGRMHLARRKLAVLTELVRRPKDPSLDYGFNEYLQAQDGHPRGQDWQTWSAAMYLYAAACVQQGRTPFFDEVRAIGGPGNPC
ncbi:MAG: amylo-alpha-1,6-glucosidase [Planctomycetes bacterium]|nr:amylo-alpha-1,6-glucosidase [Planctomycetota bacterium]